MIVDFGDSWHYDAKEVVQKQLRVYVEVLVSERHIAGNKGKRGKKALGQLQTTQGIPHEALKSVPTRSEHSPVNSFLVYVSKTRRDSLRLGGKRFVVLGTLPLTGSRQNITRSFVFSRVIPQVVVHAHVYQLRCVQFVLVSNCGEVLLIVLIL